MDHRCRCGSPLKRAEVIDCPPAVLGMYVCQACTQVWYLVAGPGGPTRSEWLDVSTRLLGTLPSRWVEP